VGVKNSAASGDATEEDWATEDGWGGDGEDAWRQAASKARLGRRRARMRNRITIFRRANARALLKGSEGVPGEGGSG
jgi:hypothetical protein